MESDGLVSWPRYAGDRAMTLGITLYMKLWVMADLVKLGNLLRTGRIAPSVS
jgi:hypothetical protein